MCFSQGVSPAIYYIKCNQLKLYIYIPHFIFQDFWTPFQLSTRRNLTSMSLLLAKAGGDVTFANPEGNSPLMSAVLHRNIDLIHGLITAGADPHQGNDLEPNLQTPHKVSPFLKACEKGYLSVLDVIMRMMSCGSDVGNSDPNIQYAVEYLLKINPTVQNTVSEMQGHWILC